MATLLEDRLITETREAKKREEALHNSQIEKNYQILKNGGDVYEQSPTSQSEQIVTDRQAQWQAEREMQWAQAQQAQQVLQTERENQWAQAQQTQQVQQTPQAFYAPQTAERIDLSRTLFNTETLDRLSASVAQAEEKAALGGTVVLPKPETQQAAPTVQYAEQSAESAQLRSGLTQIIGDKTVFEQEGAAEYALPIEPKEIAAEKEDNFTLSRSAKCVAAVFVGVVAAMIGLIGYNAKIIREKEAQLRDLQSKLSDLQGENEEVLRRIEAAQSEETLMEYIQREGMIKRER